MQFLILAYDAKDDQAQTRRMDARAAHIATIDRYKKSGNMKMGAAILDDSGKMIGSCIIAEFASREQLDAWLAIDPYVTAKVWERITISPCAIAPSFTAPAA